MALIHIGELSRRTGVSPDLLRAWERRYGLLDPERTAGGLRCYAAVDIARVRLMRHFLDQGLPAAEAAEEVRRAAGAALDEHPGIPAGDVRRAQRTMRDALGRFDDGPPERVLDRLLEVFVPAAVLCEVLLPFLRDLGERWACDEISIAQEHFASAFVERRLLGMACGWGTGSGPRALLACPGDERHTLGLIAFGVLLRDAGWRVAYLGASTPAAALTMAADDIVPEAVVLAAADARHVDPDALAPLAGRHRLALAGPGFRPEAVERLGATSLPPDLRRARGVLLSSARRARRTG